MLDVYKDCCYVTGIRGRDNNSVFNFGIATKGHNDGEEPEKIKFINR